MKVKKNELLNEKEIKPDVFAKAVHTFMALLTELDLRSAYEATIVFWFTKHDYDLTKVIRLIGHDDTRKPYEEILSMFAFPKDDEPKNMSSLPLIYQTFIETAMYLSVNVEDLWQPVDASTDALCHLVGRQNKLLEALGDCINTITTSVKVLSNKEYLQDLLKVAKDFETISVD